MSHYQKMDAGLPDRVRDELLDEGHIDEAMTVVRALRAIQPARRLAVLTLVLRFVGKEMKEHPEEWPRE